MSAILTRKKYTESHNLTPEHAKQLALIARMRRQGKPTLMAMAAAARQRD
jgi:hypothetical protein